MTPEKFDAVSRLLPGPSGRARDAARLVLVRGYSPSAAAAEVGVSLSAVTRLVFRMRLLAADGCPTCKRPV